MVIINVDNSGVGCYLNRHSVMRDTYGRFRMVFDIKFTFEVLFSLMGYLVHIAVFDNGSDQADLNKQLTSLFDPPTCCMKLDSTRDVPWCRPGVLC
ncbi:hypothetical protein SAMN05443661_1243 [Natronobacterium gregoryi]|uniref:Uncharacterized protein n=2 Tax=Natronobacterium gregoryi TaxID=44930 RepID=L0ADC3_NATGS|nr:hypothetical protein Natgr_0171 [Natronobacterium gregoryi SP2]SFJ35790.1 hypothetical protein SAMN05443661_1243 [Natronobacterium gregoryi]